VQQNGWDVRSIDGDFHLREVNVARDSREIGPCDVVIVTLKATSNSDLATILPPLLHENTIVLTLQTGWATRRSWPKSLARNESWAAFVLFVSIKRHRASSNIMPKA
jgi:ketopantoate reductase